MEKMYNTNREPREPNVKREQLFDTAHEAFIMLNNYVKHGWHGGVHQCGTKYKVVLFC